MSATSKQRELLEKNGLPERGTIRIAGIALVLWLVLMLVSIAAGWFMFARDMRPGWIAGVVTGINLLGLYLLFALKVADQWEKAVVLRFGRFIGLQGPGVFWMIHILVGRARMDQDLQKIIDERTTPWGVTVQSVEIRDIVIPQELEDAMSRQAQAERERQARVILGESEKQIAQSFADASEAYKENPTALHLRAMNMLFEGLKDKGALVIVPSSAVDTMNLGGLTGMTSLAAVAGTPPAPEGE